MKELFSLYFIDTVDAHPASSNPMPARINQITNLIWNVDPNWVCYKLDVTLITPLYAIASCGDALIIFRLYFICFNKEVKLFGFSVSLVCA